jgi:hypothetical protein
MYIQGGKAPHVGENAHVQVSLKILQILALKGGGAGGVALPVRVS